MHCLLSSSDEADTVCLRSLVQFYIAIIIHKWTSLKYCDLGTCTGVYPGGGETRINLGFYPAGSENYEKVKKKLGTRGYREQ